MSYRGRLNTPAQLDNVSTLQNTSFLVPNVTNAGQTSIYALAAGGSGDGYFNNVYTSTLTVYSTINALKIGATTGVFDTITSLSSITVNATDGNLNVLGGLDLDGNVLTTSGTAPYELLLNGIPIATTNTLSTITDWAKFPAVSSINANGNDLLNVKRVVAQDGQNLFVRASAANSIVLQGDTPLTAPLGGGVASEVRLAPDGTVAFGTTQSGQLTNVSTINGVSVNGIGGGVTSVNGVAGAISIAAGTGIGISTDSGTKTVTISNTGGAPAQISTLSGFSCYMTSSGATGPLYPATCDIRSSGGLGGNIRLTAEPGVANIGGGAIELEAQGGYSTGGLYGAISLTAQPGTDILTGIATGGSINIKAVSPAVGLTSKLSLTAGGLNLYSGLFTPVASVFGYTFMNATLGTSIVSGNFTAPLQSPGTTYIYSAQGTIIDNGLYTTDIQPIWDGNPLVPPAPLTIHGRYAGGSNVPVILNNVKNVSFNDDNDGAITGLKSINGVPYSPGSIPANLQVSSITFGSFGYISTLNQINDGIILNNTGSKISFVPNSISEYIGEFDGVKAINTNLGIGSFGQSITFAPGVGGNVGAINGLSTINGAPYVSGGGGFNPNPSFSTITMNTAGTISFTSADGVISGVSTLNAIRLTDHDIGNVGQLQVQDGFTLDGAGTITLNSSTGSPGQYIGIPLSGSYPEWVTPVPGEGVTKLNGLNGVLDLVGGTNVTVTPDGGAGTITIDVSIPRPITGVTDLNGLTGGLSINSADYSINITASSPTIDLSVNKNLTIVPFAITTNPQTRVPVSGVFYPISCSSDLDHIIFDVTAVASGTTFTVKNVSSSNDDLYIQFDSGSGATDAVGVNAILLHKTNTFNSVYAVCSWDGTNLIVY